MNGVCWIVSYPKAGNHRLRCMLTSYITGGPLETWPGIQAGVPQLEGLLRDGDVSSAGCVRIVAAGAAGRGGRSHRRWLARR